MVRQWVRSCPSVSHLFFADDSFIFCKADENQCHQIKHILHTYERASGQTVNLQKSGIYFSSSVFEVQRGSLRNILEIYKPLDHSRYLGLPSLIGSNKSTIFAYLRNRMWQSIHRWKHKFLSVAGKEVLLKSVCQAIPAYSMSVFLLPNKLTDDLQKIMNSFWWGSREDGQKKMHWLKWDRMTAQKGDGGLGYRNLKCFNLAMLAKQAWRLIESPNSLIGRILKGRYFPNTDFNNAKLGANPSFTWRSIHQASKLIQKGSRWRVGDGKKVRVWKDPWIPNTPDFKVSGSSDSIESSLKVSDLLTLDGNAWDIDKVQNVLNEDEIPQVVALPIFPTKEDKLIWHHDRRGVYTVKSGYKATLEMEGPVESILGVQWSKVWNLNVPPKVKIFVWKSLRGILPTKAKLKQRGIPIEEDCQCGRGAETVDHALVSCECAAPVWNLWTQNSNSFQGEFRSLFDRLCAPSMAQKRAEFTMMAWYIWWARNQRVWNNISIPADQIIQKALLHLQEWKKANQLRTIMSRSQAEVVPAQVIQDTWKGEVDAAVFTEPDERGMGCVIRKEDGTFETAISGHQRGKFPPKLAEALAIKEALRFVESHRLGRGVIMSDAQEIVKDLYREVDDRSEVGEVIVVCKEILIRRPDVKVAWARRDRIRVAHTLARNSRVYEIEKVWSDIPTCIASFF